MSTILLVGMAMAILSAIFWCMEAMPCIKEIQALPTPQMGKNPIANVNNCVSYVVGFIKAIILIWPLALDLLCTIWLTGAFGFGGLSGSIIGLTVSNVISTFIIIISRKEK